MALLYSETFSHEQGTTCSVSVAYAAKHVAGLKARGMTEAQWEQQKHLAQWGVIKGKLEAGTAPELPFAHWKISDEIQYKIGVKNGKVTAYNPVSKTTIDFSLAETNLIFETNWVEAAAQGEGEWTWLGTHAPNPKPVSLGSQSIGAMTDEDVATLFVKTKDEIATSKGINIKGINKQLDDEVFQAIANATGYTPKEVNQKVQAYKDTGKKLSSLKKKTVPKKAKTIQAEPPMSLAEHADKLDWGPPKATPDDLATISPPAPLDWDKVMSTKEGLLKSLDTGLIDHEDLKILSEGEKISAHTKQAAKELLDDLNGPTYTPHTAPPTHVPTQAAEDVVGDAVQAIQTHVEYLDEDVAKAYIKAKDQLAADSGNTWTLYTQNNAAFEDAIYSLMSKSYDINLGPDRIKEKIAKFISEQSKLSVLKKKMAKTGEYTPQADTLKKSKGNPLSSGKTSKTQAQQQISDATDLGYVPPGSTPWSPSAIQEGKVFQYLQNDLYAAMQPQALYDKVSSAWESFKTQYPATNPSLLDFIRTYDKKKAEALGIPNGGFYEKKLVEYASSPAGKAQLIAKQQADELLKNLPGLPADSQTYAVISSREASSRLTPTDWTASQRAGLREYTGGSYREINSALREGRRASSHYGGTDLNVSIKQAQAGMRPVPEKVLVHRGTGFSQFGVNSFEEMLQLIGKTVQDKGFLSTSVGGRGAFSGTVSMEVEVPVGTHGVYIDPISRHKGENEFLIAAGTKYEVLTVSKTGYTTTVRVRAIPGSHTKGLAP